MSGQCYGCGAEFGFFKKEHGCKNCGFAFCSNCLTKKIAVPKLQGSKHHVCNKCYQVLSGQASAEEKGRYSPPQAYIKRVAALEQREAQGPTAGGGAHKTGGHKPNPKYAALDKPDREIAQRLEKLREKPQEPAVTDKDLNARLARLKGEDPAIRTAPTKPFYQPPDRRTQVEQIDDLLDEIANEVEIDSHRPDPAADVQSRLDRLREDRPDEQNNLNKDGTAAVKNYVKNIDVGAKEASGGGRDGERGGARGTEEDEEEVQALMERASSQLEQEARTALQGLYQDRELRDRLTQLRHRHKQGGTDDQSGGSSVDNEQQSDSEDEDLAAQKILIQYLAEAKLDEKAEEDLASSSKAPQPSTSKTKGHSKASAQAGRSQDRGSGGSDSDDLEDDDELPYCILCTEDAVVRCIDCSMDLYCNRCFSDGHKQLGLTDHRSVPYKPPKGSR